MISSEFEFELRACHYIRLDNLVSTDCYIEEIRLDLGLLVLTFLAIADFKFVFRSLAGLISDQLI